MFVSDDAIKITLFWKKTGRNTVRVLSSLDSVGEDEKAKYTKVEFQMRPLNWKQHNEIQREATLERMGQGAEIDWVLYKERKLFKILIGWDIKDDKGQPVPMNEAMIYKLHPMVAETLLQEFDRVTMLGEEERGN